MSRAALSRRTDFSRPLGIALAIGLLGLIACAVGCFTWPAQFLPGYLVGFLFWTGIGLGCLFLTMLHHLAGGGWGLPIRRPMEAALATMPLMALFFIPVALSLKSLYPWIDPTRVEEHKHAYLNVWAFDVRAIGYFTFWTVMSWFLISFSSKQDETENPSPSRWMQTLSGPAMVLAFFAATFASVDWVMSREPRWASTIYGAMWVVGEGVSAFALMVVIATSLAEREISPMTEAASPERLNDLGNLLLAFVMLWAYMALSQFLIIWSGDLAEEIPWYLRRSGGAWRWVTIGLIGFHFVVPFLALFSHDSKRDRRKLRRIALLVCLAHVIDVIWLVLPATNDPLSPSVDFAQIVAALVATAGIGGAWFAVFFWRLGAAPLVPLHDPASEALFIAAPAHAGGG